MLRVACDGEAAGAEVFVNDKFRGECPLDVQVPAGTVKLRVVKKAGANPERVFEQEIRFGEGTIKKVEAIFASSRPGTESRAREEQRQAPERVVRADSVPPRPSILNPVSEEIWRLIEDSDAYRNHPKPKPIRIISNETVQTEHTGAATKGLPNAGPKTVVKIVTIKPISDRCVSRRIDDGSAASTVEAFSCGIIPIGITLRGQPGSTLVELDLKGSLFPMRVGATSFISERNVAEYVKGRKSEMSSSTKCEVIGKESAKELDPQLSGSAWKIHCSKDFNIHNITQVSRQSNDYYLEELGVMLSDIGQLDTPSNRYVLPTPGSKTVRVTEGEYGSRITTTFSSYEWKVGD